MSFLDTTLAVWLEHPDAVIKRNAMSILKRAQKIGKEAGERIDNTHTWKCPDCGHVETWNRYEDGTPICPNCDVDMEQTT